MAKFHFIYEVDPGECYSWVLEAAQRIGANEIRDRLTALKEYLIENRWLRESFDWNPDPPLENLQNAGMDGHPEFHPHLEADAQVLATQLLRTASDSFLVAPQGFEPWTKRL